MPNTISNRFEGKVALIAGGAHAIETSLMGFAGLAALERSEERRVGKECRSRWSPYH